MFKCGGKGALKEALNTANLKKVSHENVLLCLNSFLYKNL